MNSSNKNTDRSVKILLTGATGYVGGRLLRVLEERKYQVRCLARKPEFLKPKVNSKTEVYGGDVLNFESLQAALKDVDVAYYLVHSMGNKGSFEDIDRQGALNFVNAAKACGVKQIIYLGGLGDDQKELSNHLKSRHEVGEILRSSGIPTIEFRASIIIGSGSLSFEMIRALVEKLPVMITPKWVSTKSQPIFIGDVVEYLIEGLSLEVSESKVYEIGGKDIVSYRDIMQIYAKTRKLRRTMIPVPFLSPWLSSLWLGLITPVLARIGRKLVNSIKNQTLVQDQSALKDFSIKPLGIQESVELALRNEDQRWAETRWSDAQSSVGPIKTWGGVVFGNRIVDSRSVEVSVPPEQAFKPILKIGGNVGWYYGNWLWRIRGLMDQVVGGVGLRRGRRDPENLRIGESLDFWRIEGFEANHKLRLYAEMKVPGRAWLEFEVKPNGTGSTIQQTAIFDPLGLWGQLYWYILFPLHALVFSGMLRGIEKEMKNSVTVEEK